MVLVLGLLLGSLAFYSNTRVAFIAADRRSLAQCCHFLDSNAILRVQDWSSWLECYTYGQIAMQSRSGLRQEIPSHHLSVRQDGRDMVMEMR